MFEGRIGDIEKINWCSGSIRGVTQLTDRLGLICWLSPWSINFKGSPSSCWSGEKFIINRQSSICNNKKFTGRHFGNIPTSHLRIIYSPNDKSPSSIIAISSLLFYLYLYLPSRHCVEALRFIGTCFVFSR